MPVTYNPIPTTETTPVVETEVSKETEQPTIPVTETPDQSKGGVHGLSVAELNDPNKITVTIADEEAPLVILFGPPACGKTMTLVRMTRFLRENGYTVNPIRSFRPSYDTNYDDICNNFDRIISSNMAADSTDRISFMLIEILKGSRRVCQILEAPGEHYFNPKNPGAPFPGYVNSIIASSNRKIWTIMVVPNQKKTRIDSSDRANYVNKIQNLRRKMRMKDKIIFVYNMVDETASLVGLVDVDTNAAFKDVEDQYRGIFTPFKNQNPITRIWREYNCEFVPFQTGTYPKTTTGLSFNEGPEEFCETLWKCIMKKIRGNVF